MVHGKNRIPYRIDRRLTGLAGPDYDATISFGLPFEPEDSQYGKYRLHRALRAWTEMAILRPAGEGTRRASSGRGQSTVNGARHWWKPIAGNTGRGVLFETLRTRLEEAGVRFEQVPRQTLVRQLAQEQTSWLAGLLATFLNHVKSSRLSSDGLDSRARQTGDRRRNESFLDVFEQVRVRYQKLLADEETLDFHDLINLAAEHIPRGPIEAQIPARAGGRVPGHIRRADGSTPSTPGSGRGLLLGWRRLAVDLQVRGKRRRSAS